MRKGVVLGLAVMIAFACPADAEIVQPLAAGTVVSSGGNLSTETGSFGVYLTTGLTHRGIIEFDLTSAPESVASAILSILPEVYHVGSAPQDNIRLLTPIEMEAYEGEGALTVEDIQYSTSISSQQIPIFSVGFPLFVDVTDEVNAAKAAGYSFIGFRFYFLSPLLDGPPAGSFMNVCGSPTCGGNGIIEDNFALAFTAGSSACIRGDFNADGEVDAADVQHFVDELLSGDGELTLCEIATFVDSILAVT